jgi:hypothetical protein
VSANTGTVAVSLTNGISIGTYQAIGSPTGGIIMPGIAGFGTSTPAGSAQVNIAPAVSGTTTTAALIVNPTYTGTATTYYGEIISGTFAPPAGSSYGTVIGLSISGTVISTTTGSVTAAYGASITQAVNTSSTGRVGTFYGLNIATTATGTLTTAYGLFVANVSGGTITNTIAASLANASIGTFTVNTPPAGGLLVSGTVLIGTTTNDGTHSLQVSGSVLATGVQLTAGAGTGFVLTSIDALGNATWQATSSGSIVSYITGTPNQIAVSANTGTVAVSLTNGISIGTYQAIGSPTGGIIMPGIAGFGTSTPAGSAQVNIAPAVSGTTTTAALIVNPTYTGTATTYYNQLNTGTFSPPSGSSYTAIYGLSVAQNSTGTIATIYGGNFAPTIVSGTVTTFYGLNVANTSSGTVTTAYGLFVTTSTISSGTITNNYTAILGTGSATRVGIGTSTPAAYLQLAAGVAGASSAPLKFTAGTNLTSAEAGAVEFNGTTTFITNSTPTRQVVALMSTSFLNNHGVTLGTGTALLNSTTAGSSGQPLLSGGASADPNWGTLSFNYGGTNLTATPGTGQVLIGTGTNYVLNTLTSGSGISIANASGTITISAVGGGFTWTLITATSGTTTVAPSNGYVANSGSNFQTVFTIPSTGTLGDTFRITGGTVGGTAGSWILYTGTTSRSINIGFLTATTSIAANRQYDTIEVVCVGTGTNNSVWNVISSMGNMTIV